MSGIFFDSELARLRESLTQMGGAVEKMLDMALKALKSGNIELAEKAIEADREINEYDNQIVNKTILLIASHQPVASDLRFLAASLRIAGDLERVGDISANLARRAKSLAKFNDAQDLPEDVDEMIDMAKAMLTCALDAFVTKNIEKANAVLERDDVVDDMNRKVRKQMVEEVATDGQKIYRNLEIIHTAAHLERLGD
ncbi:MAG: phosphate signaling complex protein PhoU, partial [Candidatus Adiutrix sp.]